MKDFLDELIKTNSVVVNNSKKYIDNLRKAYLFAEKNSTDKDTWTGSVIMNKDNIISYGANRFAPGVKQTKERMQKPKKYLCQDHAERNAIFLAAKDGKKISGTSMFMPWVPCSACANAIITSGIKALIIHYDKCIKTPSDWIDDIKEAVSMLLEANVKIIIVTAKIGGCKAKFRGELWYP